MTAPLAPIIARHAEADTLMSFAAGSLPEPLAAVVAGHVAMCPRCRREVRHLEVLGGVLLRDAHVDPATARLARMGTPPRLPAGGDGETAAATVHRPNDLLPAPLGTRYDLARDDIPWRRLGIGVWHHPLPLSAGVEGDLRLLRIGPGRTMPAHGHGGAELTLVLDGAYRDATGTYARGDLQDADDDLEHRPVADPKAGCICLIASERRARFTGFVGRLLQPLTGI